MAGVDPPEAANLTGIHKHFNSVTLRGRANVAMFTYALIGGVGLYYYLKPKKAAPTNK